MCDIGTAFSIISGIVGFISDSQNAKDENARIAAQNEANRKANADNVRAQADIANNRLQQEGEVVSQDIQETALRARQAAATARTASGEAGVAGVSVAALQRDFAGSKLRFDDAVKRNFQFAQLNAQDQIRSIQAQGTSNFVANFRQPVATPSFLGAALRIGSSAATSFFSKKTPSVSSVGGGTSTQRTRRSTTPTFSISS